MNFYDKKILPHLVKKVCSSKHFMELRKSKISPLAGVGLELGGGAGLNLPYYSEKIKQLSIIEPCPISLSECKKASRSCSFPVLYTDYKGEELPFADNSLDFVCSTWTMCTIKNLDEVLVEVKRVLKTTGELHFIEHGLSPDYFVAKTQHFLNPAQKFFGGGCHLNRKIDDYILNAGFKMKTYENFYMPGLKFGGYLYSGIATVA